MFKLLKWNTGNAKKSKKRKKKNCPSEVFANCRGCLESHPEILEYLLWKIQENPWKTSVVVHFDLILAGKSTPPQTAAFEIICERHRDSFLF